MISNTADVLVLGAGASGLMAARTLAAAGFTVTILEARDRTGGRICTRHPEGFTDPIEEGAEFIHGHLPLTLTLLEDAGIEREAAGGEWYRHDGKTFSRHEAPSDPFAGAVEKMKTLDRDMSVDAFISSHMKEDTEGAAALRGYVEGYYAGDPEKASVLFVLRETEEAEEHQFRVKGGYSRLVRFLHQEVLDKGAALHLNTAATDILWTPSGVQVLCGRASYHARRVVITLPLGVLQSGSLRCAPALPGWDETIGQLGYGHAIKYYMKFEGPFWEHQTPGLGFLLSGESVPTWWTQSPRSAPLLTGWSGGPKAADGGPGEREALAALKHLYASVPGTIIGSRTTWSADPFAMGAYAYEVVNGPALRAVLHRAAPGVIYFAGEAFYEGIHIGTVEAALQTGQWTAEKIIGEAGLKSKPE